MGAPGGRHVTGRMIPARVCRRTASATLLAISLLTISVLPIASSVPASTAATVVPGGTHVTAPPPPLTVSLMSITPTVAVAKAQITITGSVRNSTRVPITSPVASALIGQGSLTSRQAVSDWATSPGELPLAEVATTSVDKTLAVSYTHLRAHETGRNLVC